MKTLKELQVDRELDAWIAVNLFGWNRTMVPFQPNDNRVIGDAIYSPDGLNYDCGQASCVPYYTSDPAVAMAVLEKCAERTCVAVERLSQSPMGWVVYQNTLDTQDPVAQGATLPLAIARFARKLFEV